MEEARNGGGKWSELLKTILQSQVGGWMMACVAFSAMAWWIIQDRAALYQDIHSLRDKAMPMIIETKEIADDARNISLENNRVLSEIRSYLNLPLKNQQTLEDIKRTLQKQKEPENGP